MSQSLPLKQARALAETICERLEGRVLKIEIAGSIRRGRPVVGDIDLVVLPRPGWSFIAKGEIVHLKDGVGGPEKFWRLADILCRPLNGGENYGVMETVEGGIQIDLWVAKPKETDLAGEIPGNFGTLLLCRTGSKEHNVFLCNRAKGLGLHWNPHKGVLDSKGNVIASETEEDVFRALKLKYIKPEDRER